MSSGPPAPAALLAALALLAGCGVKSNPRPPEPRPAAPGAPAPAPPAASPAAPEKSP